MRALRQSSLQYLAKSLNSTFELAELKLNFTGEYPAWTPAPHSQILTIAQQSYEQLFSVKPKVYVVHAGLECGLFKTHYPELEMISIGPTIVNPHSPSEKVEIKSVSKYWQLLLKILENAPEN